MRCGGALRAEVQEKSRGGFCTLFPATLGHPSPALDLTLCSQTPSSLSPSSRDQPVEGPRGTGLTFPLPKTRPPQTPPPPPGSSFRSSEPRTPDRGMLSACLRTEVPSGQCHVGQPKKWKWKQDWAQCAGGAGAHSRRPPRGLATVLPCPWGHIPSAQGRFLLPSFWCADSCLSSSLPSRAAVALPPPRRRQLRPGPLGPRHAAAKGRGRGGERGPPPGARTPAFRKVPAVFQLPLGRKTN